MSTKDFNSATVTTAMTTAIVTTTTTTTTSATTFTSSPKVDAETEDDDEPPTTSDVDMDMVNGPNPWLPAYDFQRQHSSYFQQMQEDLQTNDTVLMQQMDFLETILEETSDDLQSDSDRSEPTYWVGAESEAENVIQILTKQQRSADARLDGSGSEWSSAISRTRCGQYSSASDRDRQIIDDDYPESPASSRSSISSRSNSLLQFESLERTCASLSPSSSSFDSLEYANRSHAARPENTSPDSLEQDYNPLSYDFVNSADNFSRIRPYRSFESLQTCQKEEGLFDYGGLSNGFTPLGTKRDMDQPKLRSRRHHRSRDFWHEIKEYGDDDDDNDDNEDDDDAVDPDEDLQISRDLQHEDRLPMFADSSCNYSTSLDYRNTIDLREIGIESKRDTLLDLKSGQTAVSNSFRSLNMRLIIPESTANGGNNDQHRHHYNNHHHHYYKHHQAQERQEFHERDQDELWRHQRQGWSNEERFNFRFTDKFQSAPSLPSSVTESAHDPCSLVSYGSSSRTTTFVSTSNLFENYTRVASVPVDLNLCGVYTTRDDTLGSQASLKENLHEMAEVVSLQGTKRSEISKEIEETNQEGKEHSKNISKSFVKTQISPNAVSGGKMETSKVEAEDHSEKQSLKSAENNQVTSTVKTQDRRNCVFDIAMCMENDIDGVVDEAIKQLKREMEEVTSSGKNTMLPGVVKRTHSGKQQQPWKVKNNASYELAQQFEIDEKNVGSNKHRKEANDDIDKTMKSGKKRMLNNASYDLAQQCDYIKVLQSSRGAFQRMDACDELDETSFKRSSRLRVTDMVQQMNSSSISNLTDYNLKESDMDTKRYSKSTENISTQFSNAPFTRVPINQLGQRLKKGQEESYLNQLKKNSNSFSACGEDVKGQVHSVVADEIDYPCLETKPIGNSIKNEDLSREETITEKPEEIVEEKVNVMQNNSISSSEMITKDTVQVTMNGSNRWKKSYVDDRYPDNITQENELLNHRAKTQGTINDEVDKTKSSSSITLSSTTADKIVGDMLWRVIVEKKEPIMDEFAAKKAELKRERTMVTEETGERLGIGSDSPLVGSSGNNNRLEVSERSGNPAGAVAVDTNHRSSDRDKRHEEKATTVTTAAVQVCDEHDRHAIMSFTKARPSNNDSSTRFSRNVLTETSCVNNVKEERKKGGLGGFLQRFSRLRFSGRSKIPRSEVHKKSDGTSQQVDYGKVIVGKKQPDCIIIPLHPPEEEKQKAKLDESLENRTETAKDRIDVQRSSSNISANGRAPVSNKPPLPPQPPRVGTLSSRQSTAASSSSAVCSPRRRAATDLGNPSAIEMAKVRAMQAAQERTVGLLETDLDEAVSSTTTTTRVVAAASPETASGKKTRSLLNLNHSSTALRPRPEHALHVPQSPVAASHRSPRDDDAASTINQRPHKSMEFLLDKENLHFVKPPENELQKVGERVPSEHELRVQRSLQRLNVPDWYKNSPVARDGFRLKRHSDASQHGGWRTLGSKTTSLSSLSSSSHRQPTTGALLSPSPTPPVFSRWSTSLLNSAGSSPANSARSSFNHRQPYLGWRSQERLTNPRTPAERLAQGILPQLQAANKQQQQNQQQQHQVTTNQQLEVRNSIKEVTSAIVHYVQSGQEVGGGDRLSPRPRPEDWDDRGGARSTSPRGSVKLCWMESSFVGTRPVDSPETPMSLATETDCCPGCNAMASECCSCMDSATSGLFLDLTPTHDDSQQQESDGGCVSPSPSFEYHQQQPHPPSSSSSTHRHHHHHHHHHHQRQLRHQQQPQQQQQRHHRGSGQSDTDEAMATAALLRNKPSPGSTTLEDVLDSLLGLPSASRTPSPGPGPVVTSASMRHRTNVSQANAKAGKSCSDLRQDLQESARNGTIGLQQGTSTDQQSSHYVGELHRRKSEGSESGVPSKTVTTQCMSTGASLRHRRVSFDSGSTQDTTNPEKMVRCRNNKCSNVATLAEAKKTYKSCHNCTCLYCSRECRRAHWQRHRRTCLHSRAGSLCKHVLSSAKEDPITLKHISALAKRGYASHGRGTVKCFFSSPEAAEKFIANGFVDLGEPTYARWSDLLASEMGAELYAEVIRLCKSYNPETRLVLYVAVCVVSEVPTSGAVKWERQLVSRCAKIHLDSAKRQHASSTSASPQGRQPSSPCNITREMESPEMLVLTSLPGNNGQNTPKRIREISFTNIQRQLKQRGVSLRRHCPQVYKKLRAYVDGTVDKFAPVTIYPRDQSSGKSFMCIIILGEQPERLQLLPTDSSRVKTVDISVEPE